MASRQGPVGDVRAAIRLLRHLGQLRDQIDQVLATAELTEAQRNQLLRDIIMLDHRADQLVAAIRATHDAAAGMGIRRRARGGRLTAPRIQHPWSGNDWDPDPRYNWSPSRDEMLSEWNRRVNEINALVRRLQISAGIYSRMADGPARDAMWDRVNAEHGPLRRLEHEFRNLFPNAPAPDVLGPT